MADQLHTKAEEGNRSEVCEQIPFIQAYQGEGGNNNLGLSLSGAPAAPKAWGRGVCLCAGGGGRGEGGMTGGNQEEEQ